MLQEPDKGRAGKHAVVFCLHPGQHLLPDVLGVRARRGVSRSSPQGHRGFEQGPTWRWGGNQVEMERSQGEDAPPPRRKACKRGTGEGQLPRRAPSRGLPSETYFRCQQPLILSINRYCAVCKACPCHVEVVLNSCLCGSEEGPWQFTHCLPDSGFQLTSAHGTLLP